VKQVETGLVLTQLRRVSLVRSAVTRPVVQRRVLGFEGFVFGTQPSVCRVQPLHVTTILPA